MALRQLVARGVPGVALLESLGEVTFQSRFTLLSAAPVSVRHTLPQRPAGEALFPAWLGGLKYEAARAWGLPAHPPDGEAQTWGEYPSGIVWDRADGSVQVVGEPHLDWADLLGGDVPPVPPLSVGAFSADDLSFPDGVLAVQQGILAGEVYQVNLSRGVTAAATGHPLGAYLRLREDNPSPYMAFLDLGRDVIVSCSPERLVRWEGDAVSARPIAGTRARGDTPERDAALELDLRTDAKEAAEHLMLTDLIRHDLGWLSVPGTVNVPEYRSVERYSHVMHLVSEVRGQARAGLDVEDVVRATFPGGTITGAPKERVMQEIAALEPGPRGWYTGSVGVLSGARVELNILIRTASFRRTDGGSGWRVGVRAGAGIVMDSDPARETRETVIKAQALLEVLSGAAPVRAPRAPSVQRGEAWAPAAVTSRPGVGARVLLLDNHDSFTQNLAHDLAALGAEVTLRDHHAPLADLLALRPDAVMVGPGPGTPQSSGVTLPLTRACLELGWPLLGVCLGHQALGEAVGGRVARAGAALHGMPERVRHGGTGLFAGVPQGAVFTRYHSLVVRDLPPGMVTATSADGEVMAMQVPGRPAWGVQFHPESLLSGHGRHLLGNWLTLVRPGVPGEASAVPAR
ncbi:aminodeoxychorismate components I/II [Deinococcus aquiradiocola]|uniref:Aminodeoxychorismate components I/II n=1 Tax=Deinococcus aquiradiocola TaxID=393059 RepID=A0A917PD37_9DEIO|nr:aminodeoxychorismate components I/II [Deinococcus aquiradiocola]